MILVRIDQYQDFGREMRMAIVERIPLAQHIREAGTSIQYEDFVLVRDPVSHGFNRVPIKQGESLSEDGYFLCLDQLFAEEFLRALTIELARLGYSNPDPFDYRSKAMDSHIKTLDTENQRKHELMLKLVDAVTK